MLRFSHIEHVVMMLDRLGLIGDRRVALETRSVYKVIARLKLTEVDI